MRFSRAVFSYCFVKLIRHSYGYDSIACLALQKTTQRKILDLKQLDFVSRQGSLTPNSRSYSE